MNEKKERIISISRILRAVFFLCAAAFMLLFLMDIVNGNGSNIGTLCGFGLSVMVMTYTVFFHAIHRLIRYLRNKNKFTRFVTSFSFMAGFLAMIYVITATSFMVVFAHHRAPSSDKPPVVVVLGCRVIGDQPSNLLSARISTAYEYLSSHPECKCIVSGGKGDDEGISEAECMYRELVRMGIDPSRIYKEDQSTSTRENLLFSKNIMEQNSLGDTIVIVTNAWHELRACMIASSLGLSFGTEGAATHPWRLPANYLRELFGIMYQCVC